MPKAKPKALEKIISLVNVSERSEHAVRKRLAHEGYEQEEIDEAMTLALDYGFIDDMRFAVILIRSRLNQGKGTVGISRELKDHHIDINDVPGWPEDFLEDDETARAFAYLERHPVKSKNRCAGAYRKLVQRGYSSSLSSEVARKWSEGNS